MFILYRGIMPRVVDHAQRRREIVYALWAVIHERGIDGVTFQAVAAAGGVSIGRIQHYFDSKEHLIRTGAEYMVAEAEKRYERAESDPRAALVALLAQPVPTDEAGRLGVSVWYAYLAKSASDPWVRAFLEESTQGTTEETRRLLEELGMPPEKAPDEATRLVALSNGITQAVLVGVTEPPDGIALITDEVARTTT
ncbi:TetR family transcriptional regulator [Rhodococcus rhodochrous J45]|uniref:TetR family transcriptional regulator n=2 Tax=Rhodococcus rhodochrous TaxID=1829 RepID=A0A562E7S6_RHORH|nr:TetR family transcriptional regulator [Rhodococcus rhodochrous J45]